MGYRCDVALRFADEIVEVVTAARKLDEALDSAMKIAEKSDTDYYWEDVKWYSNYEEVQAVHNLLEILQEEDYGMIKVGEQHDDIEYFGDPAGFNMYTSTIIEWE